MNDFAKWFKEVIHFTLPGCIYLISAFLFYQYFSNNLFIVRIDTNSNNTILIFIFLIFISFILGLSIHYSLQRILWFLCPKFLNQFKKDIKKVENIDLLSIRRPMIMYRHLVISSIFLCVATLLYLKRSNHGGLFLILVVFTICVMIFTLAYFYLRKALIESEKIIKERNK
jgi:hypothetical protein